MLSRTGPKKISLLGLLVLSLLGSTRPVSAAEPLRIGMVPDAGATQVSVEQKAPLKSYLEQQLGMPVTLIIPTSYNATVEGLGNGSLDVAYLGGLTYVKAHDRYGAIPLAQRDVDQQFHALLVTRAQTDIQSLKDLKGKTFCFGDINSTSGHQGQFGTTARPFSFSMASTMALTPVSLSTMSIVDLDFAVISDSMYPGSSTVILIGPDGYSARSD